MGAVNEGAVYKFITKPWNDDDLRLTVGLALEQFDLINENQALKKQAEVQKAEMKRLSRFINNHHSQLGMFLLKEELIQEKDLDKALTIQKKNNKILPVVLMELGVVDEETILKVIELKLGLNRVFPNEFNVAEGLVELLPKEICEKNILIPLKQMDQKLFVAMADPTDFAKVDDLSFITGLAIQPVLATRQEIHEKLTEIYGETDTGLETITEFNISDPTENIEIILDDEDEDSDIEELVRGKDQPPAIRIVNAIISDALRHGASDVHIEPKTKYVMVRYRIDDLLQDKIHIPVNMHRAIVSRIKVMSELDISERRRPQDGRITVKTSSRLVDMRISTLPTINGEKIVLRILDKNAASKDIQDLGFSEKEIVIVGRLIEQPQGIILTTGPTGSGKTTTLYAMLRKGAKITKNFTTIEDPVEYYMGMAEQVNVREKIGLGFSTVLRSILRQDPNVIMLGEIRDHETAEVAFHAALTGHLVLSTLHTNSAISSVTRLRDMGIKPYVISDALIGVIAQRLVRRICDNCKVEDYPDEEMMRAIGIYGRNISLFKGKGCSHCHKTGYRGRIGVYEIFQIDDEIKRMIHRDATEPELTHSAKLTGMKILLEDAIGKIGGGLTTCEEVLRVFGPKNVLEIPCKHCGSILEERYHYCPLCGNELTRSCHTCGRFMLNDWRVCPECGVEYRAQNMISED
jgi:type II secretory ATPase GspE/PulE/Tfp pilus assembly ATPase PilB-like protein/RNA polymerase subunit RPABC4/transcription elongation factor Spt4